MLAKIHYWIVANQNNKLCILYGGMNHSDATKKCLVSFPGCPSHLVGLTTSDISKASAYIKGGIK